MDNTKPNSIMFGVSDLSSLTIVKPDVNTPVGYLGIGTDAPKHKIHLNEGNLLITSTQSGTSGTPAGALLFSDIADANNPNGRWAIEYINSNDPFYGGRGLNFRVLGQKSLPETRYSILFLADNGRVGIGNKDPQAKLDVTGTLKTTSATITNSLSALSATYLLLTRLCVL